MMFIAIFAARILLSTLGVENYGVYNVVGGVVAMFSSIKSVLASSVQRFMNFYKGKGETDTVKKVFNTSIYIHIVLAIIFAIVVEIIGMWFIKNYLVIPKELISAALFVFHCSLISVLVTIVTIPYDATIISNEHMNFYAYLSIADAALKLLVIFFLPLLPFQYIKSYAVFVLLITISLRILSVIYCRRFKECGLIKVFDKSLFKDLTSFASWNFLGCTASSLIEEGSNFILNSFGGVVVNAARGISYQLRSAIILISGNVIIASQPFIMQQAGAVNKKQFFEYIFLQSRILFYIVLLTCLPLYVYCAEILSLWLKVVPEYTLEITRAILIYMTIMSFQKSIDIAFKSYGKMAKYQIIDTSIIVLSLPAAYLVLKLGAPLHYIFHTFSFVRIINYAAVLLLAQIQIGLNILDYLKKVIKPCLKAMLISLSIGSVFFTFYKSTGLISLFLYIIINLSLNIISYYFIVLNKEEKQILISLINKITRNNKT